MTAHSFQHFTGAFIVSVVLIPPFILTYILFLCTLAKTFLYLLFLICCCIPLFFLLAHLVISPCPLILYHVSCYSVPHQKIYLLYLLLNHTPSLLCDWRPPGHVTSLICSLFRNSSAPGLLLLSPLSYLIAQVVGLFLANILKFLCICFFDVKVSFTYIFLSMLYQEYSHRPCWGSASLLISCWMPTAPDCVLCFIFVGLYFPVYYSLLPRR